MDDHKPPKIAITNVEIIPLDRRRLDSLAAELLGYALILEMPGATVDAGKTALFEAAATVCRLFDLDHDKVMMLAQRRLRAAQDEASAPLN